MQNLSFSSSNFLLYLILNLLLHQFLLLPIWLLFFEVYSIHQYRGLYPPHLYSQEWSLSET